MPQNYFRRQVTKKDTRVFRFYCIMKEDVKEEILQQAVEKALEKYPLFFVGHAKKACSGIIWKRVI